MDKKVRILILLWHPLNGIAGGFVRIKEFIPYLNKNFIKIIDNQPSLFREIINTENIIEFNVPDWILVFYKVSFVLGRILEWTFALFALIILAAKELRHEEYSVIYGPTGDNLHIFLAGITLKILFPKTKLVLDILNLYIPGGSSLNFYIQNRIAGTGFFRALLLTLGMVVIIFIEKHLIKICDHVVTVSPYMKKIISLYYPSDKISVTPSGVKIPNKNKQQRSGKSIFKGIFIGRHTVEKGIFDILAVWKYVVKIIPKAQLILAGPCDIKTKEHLCQYINNNCLNRNVVIKGIVNDEEKWQLLQSSDIFLHLAYYEPLVPVISILEALASGIPVIIYEVESINDYPMLRENSALRIVPLRCIPFAAETIVKIYRLDQFERKRLYYNAKKLARMFDWKSIAAIQNNVLRTV